MNEIYQFFLAGIVLIFGIPLGNFLAKITEEELKEGKKMFKILICLCSCFIVISIFLKNKILFSSFLFMTIIISRSLKK